MLNYREVAKNTFVAFFAQGVAFCVSFLTTLLVPKLLGIEQFGYWQLFVFYASYVGFFHLGLNDGVYLLEGGKTREEIDSASICSQLIVGSLFESLVGLLIICCSIFFPLGTERSFVIACIAPFAVLKCSAFYLGFVFQAINETKTYSISCVFERIVFLCILLGLLLFRVTTFEPYVVAYCSSMAFQLLYCLWKGRFLFSDGLLAPHEGVSDAVKSIEVGVKLMIANIASSLVLGVARAVIDAVWGIETFGQLSLALSMVNFFLAFITQAAMVLFPALRQTDREGIRRFFALSRDLLGLLMPIVYLLFFPMKAFLSVWLPQYVDSLIYLPFLLPICVFESKMSICCATYFKVERKEPLLFSINVAIAALSALGSVVGAFVISSATSVILLAMLSIVARSLYSEWRIASDLGLARINMVSLCEMILTTGFLLAAACLPSTWALVLYIAAYAIVLYANRGILIHAVNLLGKGAKVE